MTKETIRKEIEEIQNKLEKKKFHGRGISKAKNELVELEEKLAELEAIEEAEEIEDDGEVFEEAVEEAVENIKEFIEEVKEVEEEFIEEVKETVEEVVTDDIRPQVAPYEDIKLVRKEEEIVKEEEKTPLVEAVHQSIDHDINHLPDKEVEEDHTGKKMFKFIYSVPGGGKMTLQFRKGMKKAIKYGQLVWLTEDEVSCFRQWFKPIK